ncbi:ribonuclease E inhibitor RraA/Dimethylmenaquinone methyltransferase [Chytriomyces sp. MP71]|nr:ribonuclease E inhibitor RraA/Dimethylmenaquinone methyltransferase [Chytriomyces sp. MP71]
MFHLSQRSKSVFKMEFVRGIPTCDLADAMTRLNLGTRFVHDARLVSPAPFSPRLAEAYFVGHAHTVRFAPASSPEPASAINAIDSLSTGQVLVVAGVPGNPNAYFGGLLCARAVAVGAVAAVVDGRVRDLKEIWENEHRFAVASTSAAQSVLGAGTYAKCVAVGQPITLCRNTDYPIRINEGDIVVGDVDGVVVVPVARAEEIASLAKTIQANDARAKVDIVENDISLVDAFKKHRS